MSIKQKTFKIVCLNANEFAVFISRSGPYLWNAALIYNRNEIYEWIEQNAESSGTDHPLDVLDIINAGDTITGQIKGERS